MNIGNQVKIASVSLLLGETITEENAEEYQKKVSLEISLLMHGLGFERDRSKKVQIEQVIGLLEGKIKEIEKVLNKK
ncbi:hypothetical protein HOO68_03340 [Candidatus Gracilibacteria bacterium]|nr:hypothetical protein [Candidatus Gracilibacteria bacterium]